MTKKADKHFAPCFISMLFFAAGKHLTRAPPLRIRSFHCPRMAAFMERHWDSPEKIRQAPFPHRWQRGMAHRNRSINSGILFFSFACASFALSTLTTVAVRRVFFAGGREGGRGLCRLLGTASGRASGMFFFATQHAIFTVIASLFWARGWEWDHGKSIEGVPSAASFAAASARSLPVMPEWPGVHPI